MSKKSSNFAGKIGLKDMQHPNLYIIAGPNGAGKTTASFSLLPDVLHCLNFVNADEIAVNNNSVPAQLIAQKTPHLGSLRVFEDAMWKHLIRIGE